MSKEILDKTIKPIPKKFEDDKLNELKEIFLESSNQYLEKLTSISRDIILLDDFLQKSGLKQVVCMCIPFKEDDIANISWDGYFTYFNSDKIHPMKLRESPADIRLHVKKYLPDFFKLCLTSIKEKI